MFNYPGASMTNFRDFNHYLSNQLQTKPAFPTNSNDDKTPSPAKTDQIIPSVLPEIPYVPTIITHKVIAIDSRNRHPVRFPKANHFQVYANTSSQFILDDTSIIGTNVTPGFLTAANEGAMDATLEQNIKNIRNIKLEECVVPDFTADFPYLVLRIPEIQDVIGGTNNALRTAFAVLIPERVHGDFVTCKTKMNGLCQKNFDPPLAKLTSITMQLLDPTDTLYDTGTDETFYVLKLACEIPDKFSMLKYKIT